MEIERVRMHKVAARLDLNAYEHVECPQCVRAGARPFGAAPVVIQPGRIVSFVGTSLEVFKGEHIMIDGDVAASDGQPTRLIVWDVSVGVVRQLPILYKPEDNQGVPADRFTTPPDQREHDLTLDTCQISQQITVAVKNVSDRQITCWIHILGKCLATQMPDKLPVNVTWCFA